MMKESSFYTKLYEGNSSSEKPVKCNLCGRMCKISTEGLGFCNTQKNIDGKLYSLNYHRMASCHTDPIEKKPLYHFLPGSSTYSIGGFKMLLMTIAYRFLGPIMNLRYTLTSPVKPL